MTPTISISRGAVVHLRSFKQITGKEHKIADKQDQEPSGGKYRHLDALIGQKANHYGDDGQCDGDKDSWPGGVSLIVSP